MFPVLKDIKYKITKFYYLRRFKTYRLKNRLHRRVANQSLEEV